jgi:transposase
VSEPISSGKYVLELPEPEQVEVLPRSIEEVTCEHCNDRNHQFRLVRRFQFNSVCHYAVYLDGMTVWLPDGEYSTPTGAGS